MPWFPDFVNAVELARIETRDAGRADPVGQYFTALSEGETDALEDVWPGHVVVYDPRAGEVHGHRKLRRFIRTSQSWLAAHEARTETVATTCIGGRAVVEALAHLRVDGEEVSWPVAVVAESVDENSVEFRTYCSQKPVDGRRHLRPPILQPRPAAQVDGVVGRYLAALDAGDTEAVVTMFAPDGYYREAIGTHATHTGADELRSFFSESFSTGGIGLQYCETTDDGVRCAVECNWLRWGSRDLAPQAGLAVCERTPEGLLAAVRVYDDVEPPL